MRLLIVSWFGAALAATAFALPAQAQQGADPFISCRALSDVIARLQCYDQAADREIASRGAPPATLAAPAPETGTPGTPSLFANRNTPAVTPAPAPTPLVSNEPPATLAAPPETSDPLAAREAEIASRERLLAAREAQVAQQQQQIANGDDAGVFGMALPSFGRDKDEMEAKKPSQQKIVARDDDGTIDAIEVAVDSYSFTPTGNAVVILANGTVWRQVDTKGAKFPKRGDIFVRIERAAMGSYFMYINGDGTALRVRRVDGSKRG